MAFHDIEYIVTGPIAMIAMNRPRYKNAQSYRMLDEIDQAFAFADRVAENSPDQLRFIKIQANKAQDAQGLSQGLEDSLGNCQAMTYLMGQALRVDGEKRLLSVDPALRGRKGLRYGQSPKS